MSEEKKNVGAEIGETIARVREFGEKKDLPEETIKDFIKADIEEIREDAEDDKKSSVEDWLEMAGMGSDDQITPLGETLSNEGFMEAAGDVLRNIVRGNKPKLANMNMPSTMADVKRTYGSLAWVKSRRLVSTEITVKGGNLLQGNPSTNITKLIQAMKVASDKNKTIITKLLAECKPYMDFLSGNDWKDPAKVKAFTSTHHGLPERADFVDIVWNMKPEDAKLPTLDAAGVVHAAGLIEQLTAVYYGSPLNPFKATSWYDVMYAKNSSEHAWSNKDPRHAEMAKHYAKDKDTMSDLEQIADNLATFCYGVEYDWSANSRNGGYETGMMLRGLIQLIDATVK
ncbi:hypothetical protein D3C81_318970 [compost metagenome]